MLWGFRNPFHGLGFGSQPAEAETSQPEPQEQPAAEAAQTTDQAIPWKAWNQVFAAICPELPCFTWALDLCQIDYSSSF